MTCWDLIQVHSATAMTWATKIGSNSIYSAEYRLEVVVDQNR